MPRKVGNIVLIELESKKRVMWPMDKIEKIYSSRDGASRVVQGLFLHANTSVLRNLLILVKVSSSASLALIPYCVILSHYAPYHNNAIRSRPRVSPRLVHMKGEKLKEK
ncbi:hypothetical protein CEXT_115091 [Caerostris extrusa]|uniref:DUF5641 domain-containing protein n=1 Tax=Caerostris extrusa TaxID=172846 RepID=A0AAV4QLT0_CAEEX|nr:hypothetical protein CEXT_115091 [Caerostris extrusa]